MGLPMCQCFDRTKRICCNGIPVLTEKTKGVYKRSSCWYTYYVSLQLQLASYRFLHDIFVQMCISIPKNKHKNHRLHRNTSGRDCSCSIFDTSDRSRIPTASWTTHETADPAYKACVTRREKPSPVIQRPGLALQIYIHFSKIQKHCPC